MPVTGSPQPGTGSAVMDLPPTSFECDRDAASLVSELPTTLTAADVTPVPVPMPVNVLTTVTGRVVHHTGPVETEEEEAHVVDEEVLGAIERQGGAAANKEKRAQVHVTLTLLATFCLSLAVALSIMTLPPVAGGVSNAT